ncbi:MAG: hypothetical protein IPG68_11405 [Micrococcales bacterium]|nr:hypothetical protein [Micrococcales bacterium]
MADTTAATALIAGSATFIAGAAIGVPRVFTEPDREQKWRLLSEHLLWWRLSQPLYALGALLAALGVGALAASGHAAARAWLAVSCALLVVGALAWSWSVYRRAVDPREFAMGRLPGWPFAAYIWSTFAGLGLLGVGLLLGDWPDWLGWFTLAADALFAVAYVRFGDLPPFAFYLLFLVVGFTVA